MDQNSKSESRRRRAFRWFAIACAVAVVPWSAWFLLALWAPAPGYPAAIKLDREETGAQGKALNSSTQSLNRYHSVLRELEEVRVGLPDRRGRVSMELQRSDGSRVMHVENVDVRFLTPLLPYPRTGVDSFERANLMLAEYARNGVQLSFQESNTRFGVFHGGEDLFDGEAGEEYFFEAGKVQPNPRVRPKRFQITNNCLDPGLWELAATDSVGEMYHGWFDIPEPAYLEMVRRANDLELPDEELKAALSYRADLGAVPLALERLRKPGAVLLKGVPTVVADKEVGGYSTQDSRRKVQRGFFEIYRDEEELAADRFGDLAAGDQFRLHAFVPPGIYSRGTPEVIPYNPHWDRVEIRDVEPLTRYPGDHQPSATEQGHVEIWVYSADKTRALVVGNVSVSLLVQQEDYPIPAFGVGVLPPSELIERRYLRLREGPVPHYAYLAGRGEEGWQVLNNHEHGLEQVFLRPFEREGELFLRFTLVSYERIVDLLELEIPLEGDLAERITEASRVYRPPLFRVYRDENIL